VSPSPRPSTYVLHGLRLGLSAPTSALAEAAGFALRRAGAVISTDRDATAVDGALHFRQPLPSSISAPSPQTGTADAVPQTRFVGDRFIVEGQPQFWIDLHVPTRKATIYVPSTLDLSLRAARLLVLNTVLYATDHLLRHQGLFSLHAAGLVRGDRHVLFVAQSDSGKSTATLQLLRRGWSYVTDDVVLLSANHEDRPVTAWSFRRELSVDNDAAATFPELGGVDWPTMLYDSNKWRIDPERLYPGRYQPSMRPRLLLFPDIVDAAASTLVPMPASEALRRLTVQSGLLAAPDATLARRHLDLFTRLLRQCAVYHLQAGRDVLVAPARFEQLLLTHPRTGASGPEAVASPAAPMA
jgi:hypothetical protein